MPGKSTLALPLILLLLLGGLSHWIDRTVRMPTDPVAAQRSEPLSIVENFRALTTGPDGRPRYRLEARTLRHYNNDQPSTLVEPRFSQQDDVGGVTRVDSRSAEVSPDGNTVTLNDQVRLVRDGVAGTDGLNLSTGRLVIRPDEGRVIAPGRVEIDATQWQATAGRLEIDRHSRIVKLSGRVRAVYRNAPS